MKIYDQMGQSNVVIKMDGSRQFWTVVDNFEKLVADLGLKNQSQNNMFDKKIRVNK